MMPVRDADIRPFFFRPLEPVYFGPPSSFAAGDVLSGQTQFPPSPWTFQGLLRSRLLAGAHPPLDLRHRSKPNPEVIQRLVGRPDALPKEWQITGPLPADRDEEGRLRPWLPAPRHLLCDAETNTLALARPITPAHAGCSDLAPDGEEVVIGLPRRPHARPLGGWLSPADLCQVLTGRPPEVEGRCEDRGGLPGFVRYQRRVGLAIDGAEARARSGLIYTQSSLRFAEGSGLVGWLSGPLAPELRFEALATGTQGAGRGGRKVACEAVGRLDPAWGELLGVDHLPDDFEEGARFWLVSTTPVRVEAETVTGVECHAELPQGVRLVLETALCGHPLVLGGFSMAAGRSRPNHVYAPAGSVWLARLWGGDLASRVRALKRIHNSHLLGPRQEAPFGFGHVLVGLVDPTERGEHDGP